MNLLVTASRSSQRINSDANAPDASPERPPLEPANAHWFALRARTRWEMAVRDGLREEGVEEFLPTWTQHVRWSDRQTTTVRPLFPGYLFARFDPGARSAILAVRGVLSILSLDKKPEPISDDAIADLRRIVESPAPIALHPYVVGARIRVQRGPFAGCRGTVTRVKGATLLSIPVEIFNRSVSVEIEAADVTKDTT